MDFHPRRQATAKTQVREDGLIPMIQAAMLAIFFCAVAILLR